jgi:hypothetical protein
MLALFQHLHFVYKVLLFVYNHLQSVDSRFRDCGSSLRKQIKNQFTMKKMILMTATLLLSVLTNSYSQNVSPETAKKSDKQVKVNGPVAKFDQTVHDFGELTQSSPATASFLLTNDGNEPLLISSANASCGCTNLSWPKDPILPGKSVTISATYNAAAIGNFIKTVTVRTNASEQPVMLEIKGKVIAK